jgi:elongation factor Ts
MAAITASMVAELRGKTDAPMMECKKALTEADGDMAKAEELLRVKLGTKAGKAASRMTAEGVVPSFIDGAKGAMVEVNSETDFVPRTTASWPGQGRCRSWWPSTTLPTSAALGALPYARTASAPRWKTCARA